jgi:Ca2+-binding RTX toxin-like protein
MRGIFHQLLGSNYNDTLIGGEGTGMISGLQGDDVIHGSYGASMYGWEGNDTITGDGMLDGGVGNDTLTGGPYNDRLYGGPGNDSIFGGADRDLIMPDDDPAGHRLVGPGNDVVDGGAGEDEASFGGARGPMTIDLAAGTATGEGTDSLANIEDATGAYLFANTIKGSADNNRLYGGTKNDSLFGFAGDDFLLGDNGTDTLDGGPGNDYCGDGEQDSGCELPAGATPANVGASRSSSWAGPIRPGIPLARTLQPLRLSSGAGSARRWAETTATWMAWTAR